MAKFKYVASDSQGRKYTGIVNVKSEEELREIVTSRGYYLVSSKKIVESSQMFSFLESVSPEELSLFARQFAIMLSSGMEIIKAIDILYQNLKKGKLKSILETTKQDLQEGKMLSESFSKFPKTFPLFFRNMIEIGEISGTLDEVLVTLADYYDKDTKTKRKLKSAFSYPIFLVCMAIAVVLLISLYVVPTFVKVFEDLGADLPPITKAVVGVSNFLKTYYMQLIYAVVGLIIFLVIITRFKKVKYFFDFLKTKVPPVSIITNAVITSRFSSGLSTLIGSGMSIVDSMGLMAKLLGNLYVEKTMQQAIASMKEGKTIAQSVGQVKVFPDILIEMISVGEQSGAIEEVLKKTNSYYEDQVDVAIKRMISVIEPVMIILIGGLVVLCLLSVFLPMFDIMGSIEV